MVSPKLTEKKAWILAQNNPFEFFQREDVDILVAQNQDLLKAASDAFVKRAIHIVSNRMLLCWGERAHIFILTRPTERFYVFGWPEYTHALTNALIKIGRDDEVNFHLMKHCEHKSDMRIMLRRYCEVMPWSQVVFEQDMDADIHNIFQDYCKNHNHDFSSVEGYLRFKARSMGLSMTPAFFIQFGVELEQTWPWSGLENKCVARKRPMERMLAKSTECVDKDSNEHPRGDLYGRRLLRSRRALYFLKRSFPMVREFTDREKKLAALRRPDRWAFLLRDYQGHVDGLSGNALQEARRFWMQLHALKALKEAEDEAFRLYSGDSRGIGVGLFVLHLIGMQVTPTDFASTLLDWFDLVQEHHRPHFQPSPEIRMAITVARHTFTERTLRATMVVREFEHGSQALLDLEAPPSPPKFEP